MGYYAFVLVKSLTFCVVRERAIKVAFNEEIKTTSGIEVEDFRTLNCDGWGTFVIEDKGEVWINYHNNGGISIRRIDSYSTGFRCYNVDYKGRPISYAHELDLWLEEGGPYQKWFPYTVTSLQDLVDKYDDIIASLEKLPKNPELVEVKYIRGKRKTLKYPNEEYRLYWKRSGLFSQLNIFKRPVACDLYTLSK